MKNFILSFLFLFLTINASTYTLGSYSGKMINRTGLKVTSVNISVKMSVHNGNPFASGGTGLAGKAIDYSFNFNENGEAQIDIPKNTLEESSFSIWKKDFRTAIVISYPELEVTKSIDLYSEYGDRYKEFKMNKLNVIYLVPEPMTLQLLVKQMEGNNELHPWGEFRSMYYNLWVRFQNENDPELIKLKELDLSEYTKRHSSGSAKEQSIENGYFKYVMPIKFGWSSDEKTELIIASEDFGANPVVKFDFDVSVSRPDYNSEEMFNKTIEAPLYGPYPEELLSIVAQ